MSEITGEKLERLRRVRLVLFDVDGVLTDGRIIYDDEGKETKFFDVRDGHGIKLLMRSGIEVGIITARQSKVVEHRAKNLGLDIVYQGRKDKVTALDEALQKASVKAEEAAYMGDDIIDLPVMRRVGFSASPADGVVEVRDMVDLVTAAKGGRGAAREFAELILKAHGKWDPIVKGYLER